MAVRNMFEACFVLDSAAFSPERCNVATLFAHAALMTYITNIGHMNIYQVGQRQRMAKIAGVVVA
jgi:hypothetical protein